jgi:hypothetical protein
MEQLLDIHEPSSSPTRSGKRRKIDPKEIEDFFLQFKTPEKRISTDEIRKLFIPLVESALKDRVDSLENMLKADAEQVTLNVLTSARAATFALWPTTKLSSIHEESEKVTSLQHLQMITSTNSSKMMELWDSF